MISDKSAFTIHPPRTKDTNSESSYNHKVYIFIVNVY